MRYRDGQNVTLQAIQSAIVEMAQQNEIPVAFRMDQVKSRGLLGGGEDCLIVYHPDHQKDYFSLAIRVKYQATYAFVSIDLFGVSKLMRLEVLRKQVNATAKEGINYRGYNPLQSAVAGAAIAGAGIMGIRHLVKGRSDKEKLEIEQQWYTIICDFVDEKLS